MKLSLFFSLSMTALLFTTACNTPATEKTPKVVEAVQTMVAKPDMAKVKADIQTLENTWEVLDNARNPTAMADFYTDDAISFDNNKPMLVGKAAILKNMAVSVAKKVKGSTIHYETLDVFGSENQATEVGRATEKDASGKVTRTGKYMCIWEKRDGKYLVVRDIYNDDVKAK